jgi:hypothetical protein
MTGGTGAGRAAPQIRYALSQLRSRNGHHEFEHLCRAVARVRITANILPATGPVSAGGDKGRDFETFRTYIQQGLPGCFLASEGGLRIVFACTLQRENLAAKIKNDLRAITGGGPVDQVYFFCEQDIPVPRRRKLCQEAREDHGLEIEIIDGQALSELLAADDCLEIAEHYLGVKVPGAGAGTVSRSERPAGRLSELTGTGLQADVIHGDVNIIYHARIPARAAARHRGGRRPAPSGSSLRRGWRTGASLMAVATAVALGLILAPRGHSSSLAPRGHSSSLAPRGHSFSLPSPGTVLDAVAGRDWRGTVSFAGLVNGHMLSIGVTVSIGSRPSRKPGDSVGSIRYGTCPPEPLTLIQDDPKNLALASDKSQREQHCNGLFATEAFYNSIADSPAITITRAGAGGRDGINVVAVYHDGTLFTGMLRTSG